MTIFVYSFKSTTMKKSRITLSFFVSLCFIAVYFLSCKKPDLKNPEEAQGDPALPDTPYDYFTKHNVDNHYATLGRVLFFDKRLSINNSTSCGSCHKQEFAFANNVKFDRGFNGLELGRNSPSIQGFKGFKTNSHFDFNLGVFVNGDGKPNASNQEKVLMFWDGRQSNMSDMVLNPVTNHNEMNMPSFELLVNKLSGISFYPPLFKNAYGDESITKERIALALEAFLCCLNTSVTPIGTQIEPQTIPTNPQNLVEMGQFLFHTKYNCAECHDQKSDINSPQPSGPYGNPTDPNPGPNSNGAMFNIGLDLVYSDKGLGKLTGRPGDNGLFKVPTLQNISVTGPYMHDGRFATLNEVLDHYSHNIKANQNLSPLFKNFDGTPKKLNILPAEKNAIIAFLNTLRNDDFLTSPMYSDPFKK